MALALGQLNPIHKKESKFFNEKSDFYELWQQHKQLKTMEISETWSDTFDEGYYIHQFQPEPTHRIH